MSTTVIDQLIVTLGLDPKEFNRGQKQAAKSIIETESTVKKSANNMVASLHRVAAEFVGLFLAVRSVKDITNFFGDLNEQVRQLGIDSRNFGISAAKLRDWGNVAEMAGGNVEDAAQTIGALEKAIFDVGHGAGWAPVLTEFARLGVDTGATTGKMRDFHDILKDVATALQNPTFARTSADRFQWAQKLGLQGGIANAVVEGPKAIDKYWNQQLRIHQTSEADVAAATRLAQAWDLLKDNMRGLATEILTVVSPAIARLFSRFTKFAQAHQGDLEKGIGAIAEWANGPGPGKIIDAMEQIADAVFTAAKAINSVAGWFSGDKNVIGGARKPGQLTAAGEAGKRVTDDFNTWKRKNSAERAAGIPEGTLSNPGLPQDVDPTKLAGDLAALHQRVGGDAGDPNWTKTVAEFNRRVHYSPVGAAQTARPTPAAQAAAPAGKPTASNSVQIDNMTIHTQATDAHGIMADANRAVQRKFNVAQSDRGLA